MTSPDQEFSELVQITALPEKLGDSAVMLGGTPAMPTVGSTAMTQNGMTVLCPCFLHQKYSFHKPELGQREL